MYARKKTSKTITATPKGSVRPFARVAIRVLVPFWALVADNYCSCSFQTCIRGNAPFHRLFLGTTLLEESVYTSVNFANACSDKKKHSMHSSIQLSDVPYASSTASSVLVLNMCLVSNAPCTDYISALAYSSPLIPLVAMELMSSVKAYRTPKSALIPPGNNRLLVHNQ